MTLAYIMSYNPGMNIPRRDDVPGFAESLRAIRDRRGMTQQQVDAAAGLPLGTTAQIEQGVRAPSLKTALLLTAAVGMSLDGFRKNFTKS